MLYNFNVQRLRLFIFYLKGTFDGLMDFAQVMLPGDHVYENISTACERKVRLVGMERALFIIFVDYFPFPTSRQMLFPFCLDHRDTFH